MLKGCRALDLTNQNGYLCGKILADLGVDVIKVEPPAGDQGRITGPFWKDEPDPEKSLYWFAYNTNKRGITLNLESADGRAIFNQLAAKSDFIIEAFSPGYLDGLGLGYHGLSNIRQDIILTSITPFGQVGPYSQYQVTDIVITGMSGILYQNGSPDRAPVNMSVPQACMMAGADAAVGTMMAYYHREQTGEGQHIDVSMQQSTAWFQANAIPIWEINKAVLKRAGAARSGTSRDDTGQRQMWECKDGLVFFVVIGGKQGAKTLSSLVKWMDSEGKATDFLRGVDWDNFDMWKVTRDVIAQINGPVSAFFKTHTKAELLEGATMKNISICPLSSMENLVHDPGLKARNFWVDINHPELKANIPYPGEFIRSSAEKLSTRSRAPLIGEHNTEIYNEIGISGEKLTALKEAGVI
jgi:crotonobetainyl-CoA:carnitine CoA-transferase CaiB-like acyl-CoA transferase